MHYVVEEDLEKILIRVFRPRVWSRRFPRALSLLVWISKVLRIIKRQEVLNNTYLISEPQEFQQLLARSSFQAKTRHESLINR